MIDVKSRRSRAVMALAAILTLAATVAEARSRGSFGSRGARTYQTAPTTPTAPTAPRPVERSMTQPGPTVQQPGGMIGGAQVAQPRRFGFGTGLMAGLFGAGLLGMLFGNGFFGGLAGLAGFLGLLMQIALIGGLIWLAMRFFRRRQEPAMAGPAGGYQRQGLGGSTPPSSGPLGGGLGARVGGGLGGLGGLGGGLGARTGAGPRVRDEIGIKQADYAEFERSLVEVQQAYGREDLVTLRQYLTPEMVGYFAEEIAENARKGQVNKISDVRLLQGDLAEAWREGPVQYATVAMRYSLVDATVERESGRVVEGDLQNPQEATEIWTFRRDNGGSWTLSAIQQVD